MTEIINFFIYILLHTFLIDKRTANTRSPTFSKDRELSIDFVFSNYIECNDPYKPRHLEALNGKLKKFNMPLVFLSFSTHSYPLSILWLFSK